MEAQKKVRDICRADKCLIANEEGQELLAMNHKRFLRNLMRRKYQLAAYLQLLDIHIEQGSVPPGLRIDITPPGYREARCEGFCEWTAKTKQCSQDLVHLLRKRYVVDLKRLEQLMQCSTFQLTTIFCSLKGVTRECASFEVSDLVGRIAQESNIALLESFDKAEVVSGKGFVRKTEPNILHVSAGTNHRTLKEDKDMMEERTRSLSRLSLDSRKTYDNIYPERKSYDSYGFRSGEGNDSFFGTSGFSGRIFRNETFSSYTRNRIEAEEEEMKYLEFINSVTNDILTRGVYSDRVLTQVMERHLIQNKGKLDEGRMRHMLMKLQQDLGVSTSPLRENLEDSKEYSMRYEHPVLSDGDHHSNDLKEWNYSRPASAASSHKSSVTHSQGRNAGGDVSTPKPKKRGILKTSGVSSVSDIDRRSALSSGDEKEQDTKAQNLNLALDQPDPLLATMRMSPRLRKDSMKMSNGQGPATLSERSSSIERDLNDVVSIKSNSGYSLGSSHSVKTSSHGNDSDDVLS